MSFWAYLYLLRASCRKFFNSKEALATNKNNSEFLNEMNGECKHALQEKCQKAAIEIQHISHFSHWPVAKAKGDTQTNSLVYLVPERNVVFFREFIFKSRSDFKILLFSAFSKLIF